MTPFYKLSGSGNDFLALVEPEREPSPAAIRAWCARGLSIGADGLFTLARTGDGAARMVHYNADGSRAELCINGTRCAARLAFHLGWAQDAIAVCTDSGDIAARAADATEIEIEIPAPTDPPRAMSLELDDRQIDGWFLRVGVPHFVIAWDQALATAPVAELGPRLRAHPGVGQAGANVHWVGFESPQRFAIRSFERGVEAETLACGSGVLASTAVGVVLGRVELPVRALTRGGFVLTVAGEVAGGELAAWSLAGDARLIAEGTLLPAAASRSG